MEREYSTFKERRERDDYSLQICEAHQIPQLIEEGLTAIFICFKGEKRSRGEAGFQSSRGYSSLYIVGGLEEISKLSEEERKEFNDFITQARFLFFMIDEDEQKMHQDVVFSPRRKDGHVLAVCENSNVITNTYLR